MSVIESPVKRFPGTVVLPDFLTLPQVLAFEESNEKIQEIRKATPEGATIKRSVFDAINIPVVLSIVTEWHIAGIEERPTIENFPLTPRVASAHLIAWIIGEITRVYIGEIDIPNA